MKSQVGVTAHNALFPGLAFTDSMAESIHSMSMKMLKAKKIKSALLWLGIVEQATNIKIFQEKC